MYTASGSSVRFPRVRDSYAGNIMPRALSLPLVGLFVQLLRVPHTIIFPLIILFGIVGSYSLNNSADDPIATPFFGILGYLLIKADFEPPPFVFALVLGPLLETVFRQSLMMSQGDPSIFVTRPICLGIVAVDNDIDIYRTYDVFWAISTRVDPGRDVFVVPKTGAGPVDPSSYEFGITSKLFIDATKKAHFRGVVSTPPKQVLDRVRIRLDELLKSMPR